MKWFADGDVGAGMIMGFAAAFGLFRLEFSRDVNCFVGLGLIYIPAAAMFDASVFCLMLWYMLRRANRFA